MSPLKFNKGSTPLLISIPHCGVALPAELETAYTDKARTLTDTDWHLERLYRFAGELGAGVIRPHFSRYVIDLNRPPDNAELYPGANGTHLCPTTDFSEDALYLAGSEPDEREIDRRLASYWQPYHQQVQAELRRLKQTFGLAVLFEAHSIQSVVPRLFDGELPDLNLGTADGTTCSADLLAAIQAQLQQQEQYSYVTDQRFKGGYITRAYGNPGENIHSLQLELSQRTYMEENDPFQYRLEDAARVQPLLIQIVKTLINWGQQESLRLKSFQYQERHMQHWDTLLTNVNLATMNPQRTEDYGAILDGAIAVKDGRIAWLGDKQSAPDQLGDETIVIDGEGRWVTPGLIDCHTHLVYGGNRAQEFELRLKGVDYAEIARRGGGILSTVRATREASEEELYRSSARRLQAFLNEGVTGIEIKSGYGLDRKTELKMLRVARKLGENFPITTSITFLGAHALPPEFSDADQYIDYLCDELLPEIALQQMADAVDIFCESIGFNLAQTEKLFTAAQTLGLPIKAHVEQLSHMGGAELAARFGARSADHLEYLDEAGVTALQAAGTVAVLLPGAFYFLRESKLPPIELLRQSNVPMAIASDCNPGSSPATSLLLMLNMACTLFDMTPEEALSGVTLHAARALGWENERGSLQVAKQADLVLWDIDHPAELSYHLGHNPCYSVWVAGEQVPGRI